MSQINIDSILNLSEFFKQLKDIKKQGNIIDLNILKNAFKKYPFLFGCLKTILSDQETVSLEEKMELIDFGLQQQQYCRQIWETYIDFAIECNINEMYDQDIVLQLYKQYMRLTNYTNIQFIIQYFKYLRDKYDSKVLINELDNFLKQKMYIPHFLELRQQLNDICNNAQQIISFESYESYKENQQNSQLLIPHYELLGKRDFYSPEKLSDAQINALSTLIAFYAQNDQFQYLIHLFYISLSDSCLAIKIYYILQLYQAKLKNAHGIDGKDDEEEAEEFSEDETGSFNYFKVYRAVTLFLTNNEQHIIALIGNNYLKKYIILNADLKLSEIMTFEAIYIYVQLHNYRCLTEQNVAKDNEIIEKILSFNQLDNSAAYLIHLVAGQKQKQCSYQYLDYIYSILLQFQFKNVDPVLLTYLDCFVYLKLDDIMANFISINAQIKQLQQENQQYYQILVKHLLDKGPHFYMLFIYG